MATCNNNFQMFSRFKGNVVTNSIYSYTLLVNVDFLCDIDIYTRNMRFLSFPFRRTIHTPRITQTPPTVPYPKVYQQL